MDDTKAAAGWDWPLLFYIGTVMLNMSPRRFWRTTPALFNTLSKVHSDIKNPDAAKTKVAQTVEEVPFLI